MASIFGDIQNYLSNGDLGAGTNALNAAAQVAGSTQTPDLTTLIPQLQKQVQQGTMTPAQMQAAVQQASATNGISTNPQLAADQAQSLAQLKNVADTNGLTAQSKAQLNDIQNQLGNQNSAQQSALQNQFAQQGQGGSGASMQARMLASQGNANSGALAGSQVAGNAQQNALQAMQNYGTMAQGQQNQQFGQQFEQGQAQNAINQFNAQNSQQANAMNAANQQQSNAANFGMANQIAGTNTGIANTQAMMPYNAAQQNFTNALNRNATVSNALNKQGTALLGQGNTNATSAGNMVAGVAAAAPAIANAATSAYGALSDYFSDERMKKDVKPADESIEAMMDKLVGKTFKYKDDNAASDGGKPHIGVMAQNIEKAGLPTSDTPNGKMVMDNDEMRMAKMAMLGNLHKRVRDLEAK